MFGDSVFVRALTALEPPADDQPAAAKPGFWYEFACHQGNYYAAELTLRSTRAAEAQAR